MKIRPRPVIDLTKRDMDAFSRLTERHDHERDVATHAVRVLVLMRDAMHYDAERFRREAALAIHEIQESGWRPGC